MQIPSMQDLLEAGVHFGHQVRRWNPKMQPFIFTAREGIHVIDLAATVDKLTEACEFVKKIGQEGGVIVFLASKKQAKTIVEEEAKKAGAMYITERWIGGLLTNWDQTSKNLKKLANLKKKKEEGGFTDLTKKENLLIDRDINKLERFYGGVATLEKLPDALFVVDVRKEENACREAKKKEVPIIALCDTNANVSLVDYPIPGNDDAIKAIEIVTHAVAEAYAEGKAAFAKKTPKEKVEAAGEAPKGIEGSKGATAKGESRSEERKGTKASEDKQSKAERSS